MEVIEILGEDDVEIVKLYCSSFVSYEMDLDDETESDVSALNSLSIVGEYINEL